VPFPSRFTGRCVEWFNFGISALLHGIVGSPAMGRRVLAGGGAGGARGCSASSGTVGCTLRGPD
jgi:hypothetical protein